MNAVLTNYQVGANAANPDLTETCELEEVAGWESSVRPTHPGTSSSDGHWLGPLRGLVSFFQSSATSLKM